MSGLGVRQYVLAAGLVVFILISGTELRLYLPFRAFNAVLGAIFIWLWLRGLRRGSDRVDLLVVLALALFLVACALSRFPRMSFESATSMLAFAAVFGVARRELVDPKVQRVLIVVLATCGAAFIVLFAAAWAPVWAAWVMLRAQLPPLDLALPDFVVFDFKYIVAVLIGMLVPAVVGLRRLEVPGALVYGVSAIGAVLIVMSGSRSAWLAGLVVVVGLVAWRARSLGPRPVMLAGAAVASVAAVAIVTGVAAPFVERAFAPGTLALRAEIWGEALEAFVANPLAGSGPGTFPTTITLSGYFTDNPAVGRGPDSAVVQLLSEGGILGVAALILAVAALAVGVRSAAPNPWAPHALAGIGFFAISSLTNDSVVSSQLLLILIVWSALAAPMQTAEAHAIRARLPATLVHAATVTALAIVGSAVTASLTASVLFDGVRSASHANVAAEIETLETVVRIDPSNALYRRELGTALYLTGQLEEAQAHLDVAVALSPGDVAARRTASLVALSWGDTDQAIAHADAGARIRVLDPMNLATLAWVAGEAGDGAHQREALVELLSREPWLPAAASWQHEFPTGVQLDGLLAEADDRRHDRNRTDRETLQRAWLAGELGRPLQVTTHALSALYAWFSCDLPAAQAAIDASVASESPDSSQIVAGLMVYRSAGLDDQSRVVLGIAQLRFPAIARLSDGVSTGASPTQDVSEDLRLYRQPGIQRPFVVELPTYAEAISTWLRDPLDAARDGAPAAPIAGCELPS